MSNMTSIPETVEKKKPGNWWVPISMVLYTLQGFALWGSVRSEREITLKTGLALEPVPLNFSNLLTTLASSLGFNILAVAAILLCAFRKSSTEKWVMVGIGVVFILVQWFRRFF